METRYSKYEPIFGSWYIKSKIGEGSAGEVFLIEREDMGMTYRSALKCITVPKSQDEMRSIRSVGMTELDVKDYYASFMKRINAELGTMAKLKGNSNVVSYEDHIVIPHEEDVGWDILIRMELLTPLLQYSEEHKLDEDDVIRLGIDMCKAMELCGRIGVIHRDIKPENIFISDSGDFKLGNFGISRTLEETRIGLSRKGTFTYMAPEVYKGEPYGVRSDIYSLGLVLYKFLNGGRNAFLPGPEESIQYEDADRAFFRRMSGAALPPPAGGSKGLQSIVLKACSYPAKNRYENPDEMRTELENLLYRGSSDEEIGKGSNQNESRITVRNPKAEDHSEGVSAAVQEAGAPKRIGLRKKIIIAIVAAAVAATGIVYAAIPKKVEAVSGIDDTENVYIGETKEFTYTIKPDWFKDEPITFRSSNEKIMKVTKDGAVKGVALGDAKLDLKVKGYTKNVVIHVVPKVSDIKSIKKTVSMEKGDSYQLKPKLAPKKFADEKITYSSSDGSVVKVNKKGKLTAKESGSASVAISAGGRTEKIKVTVTEPAPEVNNDTPAVYNDSQSSGSSDSYSYDSSGSGSYSSGGSGGSGSASSGGSGSSGGSSNGDAGSFDSKDDEYF